MLEQVTCRLYTLTSLSAEYGGDDDLESSLLQRIKAPIFEAFWQGRLIPGSRIDSLPFIEVCL